MIKKIIIYVIILGTSNTIICSQGPTLLERVRAGANLLSYIRRGGPNWRESGKRFSRVGKLALCLQKQKFKLAQCATTPAIITMRPGRIEDVLVALLGGTVLGIRAITDELFGYRLPGTTSFEAGILLQMQNLLPKGEKIDAGFAKLKDVAQGLDEILKAVGEDLAHVLNVPFPQRPGQPPTIDLPPVDMPKLNQQDADMIVASAFAGDPAVPGSGLSENDTTALAMTPD